MRKKLTAMFLSFCMVSVFMPQAVLADDVLESGDLLTDGEDERAAKRQEIVDYALQFEGNPYVYGGTSLTNGADCSGFVMSVFANFGYELPRVAASQYMDSEKKDMSEMETGDLVFYGDSPEGIYHVALYIGNGKVIHASTAETGIKISDYDCQQPYGIGTYVE